MRTFEQTFQEISKNSALWMEFYKSTDKNLIEPPPPFSTLLTHFQKLLLFKCFRPTKILHCIRLFIENTIGIEFIEPLPLNIASAFSDSTCKHPLLFIISSNSDPLNRIEQFARSQSFGDDRIVTLSLGQQSNNVAMKIIEEGTRAGQWIVLQNCHLAKKWMQPLERVFETLAPDSTHPDFRLWLTSSSVDFFPLSILHNCIKLVDDTPKCIKDNILRSFTDGLINTESWTNACQKELIYPLCRLHAIIKERIHFGSIGWINHYAFNEIDLKISIEQVIEDTKYETIQFLLGECIYGGRIMDSQDKLCLNALIKRILNDSQNGSRSANTFDSVISYIQNLPTEDNVDDFSLHSNAEIIRIESETNQFIESIQTNCLTLTNEVIFFILCAQQKKYIVFYISKIFL